MTTSDSAANARRNAEAAGMQWHEEADRNKLADALADAVLTRLQHDLDQDRRASLVVSGGSTPAPVFASLSRADINWANVSVTLADERWVPPGHADSNESLVRDTLLVGKAAKAEFVSLFRDGLTPEQAPPVVSAELQQMTWPFSAVILGMGGDGHTASLFPDAPADELSSAMALDNENLVAIMHPPSQSQVRITLTRAALLQAKHRFLHITGEEKTTVLAQALDVGAGLEYQPGKAPVVGLLTQEPAGVSVFWSP